MKVVFFCSDKARERVLADAFLTGVRALGDEIEIRALQEVPEVIPGTDIACMVGVKSRELFQAHWRAGIHTVYFDKGYSRHKSEGPVRGWEYWRIAIDGHHPTRHLMMVQRPPDRFESLEIDLRPWRTVGYHILYAGSSQKYNDFYGLGDANRYARKQIKRIRSFSDMPIVYRPKPSFQGAVEILGTRFSQLPETMDDVLNGCHALVTHGSNACFEAIIAGVPCIITGDAVAATISSRDIEDVSNPIVPTDADRLQWLSNLAYFQYTLREMSDGMAWQNMRPFLHR